MSRRPPLWFTVTWTVVALVALAVTGWFIVQHEHHARPFEPAMPCAVDEVYVWVDRELNRAKCVDADDHVGHTGSTGPTSSTDRTG